jgi:hypoxanthine phosphoribosyltransferase
MTKVKLILPEIAERIRKVQFPEVDLVIGIASGGIVPASLVAFHLNKSLEIVEINYRDEDNNPRYEAPQLLTRINKPITGKRILLVDDVSVTGETLKTAIDLFDNCEVTTFVLKGQADISAFPEVTTCVDWPWRGYSLISLQNLP